MELTLQELKQRRARFITAMEKSFPGWDTAIIVDNVNQYYFTGTIQDGVLFIRKDGSCLYGVRRSFDRAKLESPLEEKEIMEISTYRNIAEARGAELGNTFIEGEVMPVVVLERLKKYFSFASINSNADFIIRTARSVKSPYEIRLIECSGEQHRILLEERVPALLREGMSEAELLGEISNAMFKLGYQGITRFHQFQVEVTLGQIGFGLNTLYPSKFDGPGGAKGNGAAAPLSADKTRKLKKGDVVFVDLAFGVGGYHSDKTQVYMFGAKPPEEFVNAQRFCVDTQKRIAERLRPGEIPSRIYQEIIASLSEPELDRFMGVDNRHRVKFLGHGVGLNVDEFPVLARGFDEALEEDMVLALEPKKGVAGIGMAGVEDTYIVGPGGGRCVTGGGRDIIVVD
ncbi:MAG: M24 family metallopeptidase [Treponema sp.]|jgi:Xaa-Pro aminopeptidase|nr:M24 family metallopeptidase [Treponema sp.]